MNGKRPRDDRENDRARSGHGHSKRRKQDHHQPEQTRHHGHQIEYPSPSHHERPGSSSSSPPRQTHHLPSKPSANTLSYADAYAKLPAVKRPLPEVPAFSDFKVAAGLPELPSIPEESSEEPFRHKSQYQIGRTGGGNDGTYEHLEFVGDAYIETIASRLLYHRSPDLTAGRMSQLRELLVKNETLAEYSRAYGFDKKVQVGDLDKMMADSNGKGNKGFNKILGDVMEAYTCAVIHADVENGFAVAEKWLTQLWAPKLIKALQEDKFYDANMNLLRSGAEDPLKTYDPEGKAKLQKRIMTGNRVKLQYEAWKPTVELKGDKLGQNRHFIALYLTGFGHERKLLGKGEGKNKVEAGNWAAIEAMYGEHKDFVDELEKVVQADREEYKKKKAAEAEKQAKAEAAKETK